MEIFALPLLYREEKVGRKYENAARNRSYRRMEHSRTSTRIANSFNNNWHRFFIGKFADIFAKNILFFIKSDNVKVMNMCSLMQNACRTSLHFIARFALWFWSTASVCWRRKRFTILLPHDSQMSTLCCCTRLNAAQTWDSFTRFCCRDWRDSWQCDGGGVVISNCCVINTPAI